MQYLLTQEEMDDLIPRSTFDRKEKALFSARLALLKHANFVCIHDAPKRVGSISRGYCDDCPMSFLNMPVGSEDLCTRAKNYSK